MVIKERIDFETRYTVIIRIVWRGYLALALLLPKPHHAITGSFPFSSLGPNNAKIWNICFKYSYMLQNRCVKPTVLMSFRKILRVRSNSIITGNDFYKGGNFFSFLLPKIVSIVLLFQSLKVCLQHQAHFLIESCFCIV